MSGFGGDLPAEVRAYIQSVPEGAQIRGMFLNWVLDHVERAGHPADGLTRTGASGWSGFRWVPLPDYLELLTRAMHRVFPHLPPQEGFRRHGHYIYENFSQTMVGKSVFAGALSPLSIIRLAPRCYSMVVSPGSVHVDISDELIAVTFDNVWTFNESLQLGTWEGVLRKLGMDGSVRCYRLSDVKTRIEVEIDRSLIRRFRDQEDAGSGPAPAAPSSAPPG